MKLTLAEPKLLVDSVSIISELVNEVKLKVDKEKILLTAMDPANVAMIDFKLLSSAFTEYKVDDEVEIGVSLDSLKQILKRAKPSDVLIMELDKDKAKLKIQLRGESSRTFNLALLDLETGKQRVPDLKFDLRIDVPSYLFNEAIEDMDVVAESVALVVMKDRLFVESEGKMNNARVEVGDENTKVKNDGGEVKGKYSIEYLKKMIKASKLADNVIVQFGKEYPLRLEYNVKDKVSMTWILAPRVAND
ncbi:proliferating cell nuclear antigen (pcna) [Candidatus Woesearchaeota archaeon]|nr:proliferating cell nuclear antigen (pcna) [Candidatus Woesearchaeota archaeon]